MFCMFVIAVGLINYMIMSFVRIEFKSWIKCLVEHLYTK